MPTTDAPASDLHQQSCAKHSIANVAKTLCTTYVDPESIAPFVACRLIALNKNPGVRPIGIGDTAI